MAFGKRREDFFIMRGILLLWLIGAVFCCGPFTGMATAAGAMDYPLTDRPDFSLGLGIDYATGDYGTGSDSDFVSVPLYLDLYPTARLDLELIVPYVYQRLEDGGMTTVLYHSQGSYAAGSAARKRAGRNGSGGKGHEADETDTTRHHTSESGLGDVTLTAGYIVVEEGPAIPQVRPTVYLKVPTADEDRGLGTGEFDFGPGLTLCKWLGDWYLFAEGQYVAQGDSSRYDTKDYFNYNGGVGYQLSENFHGALQARGATAPVEGADESLEGRFKWIWRLASDVSLEGYVGTGLNDNSADFSSSLAVFFDF